VGGNSIRRTVTALAKKSQANREGQEDSAGGGGIERELRVVRVGPNPRMVVCEYWELAQRKVVVVKVGLNRKWLKGMRFKIEEPLDEAEYNGVWQYKGAAPRRKGRW
jgi:hypothetical protein